MSFKLEVIIPGVPKIATNGPHGHWSVRSRERKKWRHLVVLAIGQKKPSSPFERVFCTFIRATCREPDFDNLVASMKPIRDGLVDAGIVVNDKTSNMPEAKYIWEKAAKDNSHVRVIVEEVA